MNLPAHIHPPPLAPTAFQTWQAAAKAFYANPNAPDVPGVTIGITRLPALIRKGKELTK